MVLVKEMEDFVHLIARSIAKAAGSETPDVYADTVVEHARALADAPADKQAEPAAPVAEAPAVTQEQAAQ